MGKLNTLWSVFGMVLIIIAGLYVYFELRPYLNLALVLVIALLVVATGAAVGAWVVILANRAGASSEERLLLAAQRRAVEAEADNKRVIPTVTKPGEILNVTYLDGQMSKEAVTVLPTLAGSVRVNGSYVEPSQIERENWLAYMAMYAPKAALEPGAGAVPLIEGPVAESMPDPQHIMKEKPHLWLVGETRSGKTSLSMHWLSIKGGERFIIDPKPAGLNPWPGGTVAGNNGNEQEAVELYQHFMNLAGDRIKAGSLDGEPLVLLIDETMFVVAAMADQTGQSARETWGRLHKMATICAEYKIFLAITSTAPQAGAVGAEGLSGLLNNYAKFETIKRIEAGRPVHELYHYPKTTDHHNKYPVQNLGPYRGSGQASPFDPLATKRAEARRLLDSGLSERQVCLRLFGGDGGEQYNQLRTLLGSRTPSATARSVEKNQRTRR